ncbi:MAPEG family protein [Bradyrhizobium japonicum]|uniref:MAPEG family protein n=1 Tax=Bradyrhizobium japonicum TaxID=375 RepID=UPI00271487B7|nr:MAPEG family protein [Bradyrhizobium japonicum]WLB24425.1 MAPEG family protein [Bradyrhizobium japonicum]
MTTFGVARAIGVPGPDYPVDAPRADRARRAHLNAVENLAVFAPLVLLQRSSMSARKQRCSPRRLT